MDVELKLPDIGEGIAEGEIVRWLVAEGAPISEDDPLVEVLTDKANVEIPSPAAGVLAKILAFPGQVVKVGETLAVLETTAGAAEAHDGPEVLATPAVRKLAKDLGLILEEIRGSGPGGRITEEDLRAAAAPDAGPRTSSSQSPEKRIPLRGKRRMIARKMAAAKSRVPHALLVEEADAGEIVARARTLRGSGGPGSVHVTVLPFVFKAVAAALRRHPALNASLDEATEEIILRENCDIGMAVDVDDGLVVPVIRNVDSLPLMDVAEAIERLSTAAREGKLAPQDLSGGTFTVTSIGSVGGLFSYPIINIPEAAILAVHRIATRPVARNGEVVLRDMLYLSLSFDHRIVDGGNAARFLNEVVRRIESPEDGAPGPGAGGRPTLR